MEPKEAVGMFGYGTQACIPTHMCSCTFKQKDSPALCLGATRFKFRVGCLSLLRCRPPCLHPPTIALDSFLGYAHCSIAPAISSRMARFSALLLGWLTATSYAISSRAACPDYSQYSTQTHQPLSAGKYQLSFMRPEPACRKYTVPEVEKTIDDLKSLVKDPDLFRLFENAFPNTLDTTISWKGFADNGTEEEVRGRLDLQDQIVELR